MPTRYAQHKKSVLKWRRERWHNRCDYCGHRWRKAKTNYLQPSGICLFCNQYLCQIVARGAAWIIKRRQTLNIWDRRLSTLSSATRQPAAQRHRKAG